MDNGTEGKVLVVDDDPAICAMLRRSLEHEGFEVASAADGEDGVRVARAWLPDVALIDIMLPGIDGIRVCREIRHTQVGDLGIIMLTARTLTQDKVAGLEAGADDYVTKPFRFPELLARVRAQLRRRFGYDRVLRYRGLSLDCESRMVTYDGLPVLLTGKECELLRLFLGTPLRALSRDYLAREVWGPEADIESNVIDVYVARLRRRLQGVGAPAGIRSVRGYGYMLAPESAGAYS